MKRRIALPAKLDELLEQDAARCGRTVSEQITALLVALYGETPTERRKRFHIVPSNPDARDTLTPGGHARYPLPN